MINSLEFKWFLPAPPKPELAITIPNDKCFNLNQNLCSQMPNYITIGVLEGGKTLCLKKETEIGYQIPKSGSIKAINIIEYMKKQGIKLPARYLVEEKEAYWIATLVPPSAPSGPAKKMPHKSRKMGLEMMLPQVS